LVFAENIEDCLFISPLGVSSMKVDKEKMVFRLVSNSRALGEALFAKRLTQTELSRLNLQLKLYREEGLTILARDLQVDRKTLIQEQRHYDRNIPRLRRSIEITKRKLLLVI
jgi:hypothetical protein